MKLSASSHSTSGCRAPMIAGISPVPNASYMPLTTFTFCSDIDILLSNYKVEYSLQTSGRDSTSLNHLHAIQRLHRLAVARLATRSGRRLVLATGASARQRDEYFRADQPSPVALDPLGRVAAPYHCLPGCAPQVTRP